MTLGKLSTAAYTMAMLLSLLACGIVQTMMGDHGDTGRPPTEHELTACARVLLICTVLSGLLSCLALGCRMLR